MSTQDIDVIDTDKPGEEIVAETVQNDQGDHVELEPTAEISDRAPALLESNEEFSDIMIVDVADQPSQEATEREVEKASDEETIVDASVDMPEEASTDKSPISVVSADEAPTAVTTIQVNIPEEVPPVVKHRLGEYFVERNIISRQALEAASREQEVTGERIGQILVANGFLTDKDRIKGILEIASERIAQESVSQTRIPVQTLDEYSIIISAVTETEVFLSTMEDERIVAEIARQYYPDKKIRFVSYSPSAMNDFISRMSRSASIDDRTQSAETMIDRLLYRGLTEGASDIHIMPRRKSYTVMFRILGVRRIVHEGSLDEYNTMMAQLKDRARMDLAEKRKPQDGGFQFEHNGKMIDLRVAAVPAAEGEICVLRILDPDRVQPTLGQLGITRIDRWRKGFQQLNGLCLICGQTGSGKTTTLNSSIREIDRFGKSIYTIEDPVEYRISYTGQVSVNTAVGLSFSTGLRALMRADPDVIVLGEVRDEDTARNAVKAADTGHLVIATLHTGSIVGAVSRLRDLGIDPRELRYLLRAVLVQTLIRVKCDACDGDGCVACGHSGYKSRTVVSECEHFQTMEDVDRVIEGKVSWPTIAYDAVLKYRQGLTTEEELRRVFGSSVDEYLREGS